MESRNVTNGADLYQRSKKEDECFLITHYVSRRLAYPVARLFQRLGVSADGVTLLGGLAWLASVVTLLLAGAALQAAQTHAAWAGLLASAVLWNAGYILDVADGSLARMTGTTSSSGFFLDFYFHLLFMPMFLCSIGAFLYLADGHWAYLLLAVFSIGGNWGVSFGAKEHVLCEEIAKGRCRPEALGEETRYAIFIDSPRTKTAATEKLSPPKLVRHLAEELLCFPGQFSFFGLAVFTDFALSPWLGWNLPVLKGAFLLVAVAMLLRVPFRLRRELRTMRQYDARAAGPGSARPDEHGG